MRSTSFLQKDAPVLSRHATTHVAMVDLEQREVFVEEVNESIVELISAAKGAYEVL